jgi:pyruvate/2-oxoglutarate dehydrogenase complex dihydrolipoamide acyltransferase (E2) component
VPFRSEILSRSKRTEIRYLTSSYRTTLPSVVTVAVPTRGLRAAAAQCAHPPGITTAIILFEVARLLQQYPRFNAFYAEGTANLYESINIGFALDAGHGLKVPVIRQANTKSLPEIASEMQELLRRYLDNALQVDDLAAGTFTITDLSSEGVLIFHPLINQGQAAILGIGSEYGSGPGPIGGFFTLTLSFDHQLNEGRQAAQFLQELARRLQAYEAAMQAQTSDTGEPHCARCQTSLSRLRELDHDQRGAHFLVQTIQPDGTQAYLCSHCMQGW